MKPTQQISRLEWSSKLNRKNHFSKLNLCKLVLLLGCCLAQLQLFGTDKILTTLKSEFSFACDPVYRKIPIPFNFDASSVESDHAVILSFQAKYRVNPSSSIAKFYYQGRPREILCLQLNNTPLTNENRIMPEKRIIRTNMTAYDACNPYTNAWNLLHADTFEVTPALKSHVPLDTPFDYAIEVTDLLKEGKNVFTIIPFPPAGGGQKHYDIDMRNIVLKTVPKATISSKHGIKAGTVPSGDLASFVPLIEDKTDYKINIDKFGGIRLGVNEEAYSIQSLWYWPNKGINILGMGKGATAEKDWLPKVTEIDEHTFKVIAAGQHYKLERTIKAFPGHIDVYDHFTNLKDTDTPIVGRNSIIPAQGMNDIYARGVPRISEEGTVGFDPQNPTIFINGNRSGLGMMVRDDAMRNSIQTYWNRKSAAPFAGIELWHYVLPPKGECTLHWTIVPTADRDYWRFVNTMRKVLDTNFTIPGLAVFISASHPLRKMSDDEIKKYVENRGIKLFLTDHFRKPDPQNPSAVKGVQGSDALNDYVAESRENFRKIIAKIKNATPDVKVLMYFHSALCSEPDASTKYVGCRALVNGKSVTRYSGMFVLFPTLENSYGKVLEKTIDMIVNDLGFDGLYWDEMTTGYVGDADEWSGHHAHVSRRDFTAGKRYSFTPLLMTSWKEMIVKRLMKENKLVVANTNPSTETMTKLHFPRFVEYNTYDSCAQGQLYTPITVTQAERSNSSANILKQAKEYLDHGSLTYELAPYNQGPGSSIGITYDNLLRNMYPFTPVYIQPGVMIGKERILFSVPGKFGWGDGSMPSQVKIFDENGKPVDGSAWVKRYPEEGITEVRLPEQYTGALIK